MSAPPTAPQAQQNVHKWMNIFSTLPPELSSDILDELSREDLKRLSQVCKNFYDYSMLRLHKRAQTDIETLLLGVEDLADTRMVQLYIPQPVWEDLRGSARLTRHQRGLTLRLNNNDHHLGDFVRQLVIDGEFPSRYVPGDAKGLDKYVDALFEYMPNLELVHTARLTQFSANLIVRRGTVRSLRLDFDSNFHEGITTGAIDELSKLTALDHLYLRHPWCRGDWRAIAPLLTSSSATLKTLRLWDPRHWGDDILWPPRLVVTTPTWEADKAAALATTPLLQLRLPALESLTLEGGIMTPEFIDLLVRRAAIDVARLRHLCLARIRDPGLVLFRTLARAMTAATRPNERELWRRPQAVLHTLDVVVGGSAPRLAHVEDLCAFLDSFDSLAVLLLENVRLLRADADMVQAPRAALLASVMGHAGLRRLRLSFDPPFNDDYVVRLSPLDVSTVVEGLPMLEEFEFVPWMDFDMLYPMGEALSKAPNLKFIALDDFPEPAPFLVAEGVLFPVMHELLCPYLVRLDDQRDAENSEKEIKREEDQEEEEQTGPSWEERYKLRDVRIKKHEVDFRNEDWSWMWKCAVGSYFPVTPGVEAGEGEMEEGYVAYVRGGTWSQRCEKCASQKAGGPGSRVVVQNRVYCFTKDGADMGNWSTRKEVWPPKW